VTGVLPEQLAADVSPLAVKLHAENNALKPGVTVNSKLKIQALFNDSLSFTTLFKHLDYQYEITEISPIT